MSSAVWTKGELKQGPTAALITFSVRVAKLLERN